MQKLPGHLPVLALPATAGAREHDCCERLIGRLGDMGIRACRAGGDLGSAAALVAALVRTDLLIVDGPGPAGCAPLWLGDGATPAPDGAGPERRRADDGSGLSAWAERIGAWLDECARRTPLTGAVLIGGRSSRMGRPKHLIRGQDGRTWLERTVGVIGPFVDELVVSGAGDLPGPLRRLARIDDLPGVQGPLAGIGALFRGRPYTSWLVLACDMPEVAAPALDWLLGQRRPGCRALLPTHPESGRREPLLAWYDYRCGPLIDALISSGIRKISELGNHALVLQPPIPAGLLASWRNVNSPDEL